MKIELRTSRSGAGDVVFNCRTPYLDAEHVIVEGAACPVCEGKVALVDASGVVRALSGLANLEAARWCVRAEWGKVTEVDPPDEYRVRGTNMRQEHEQCVSTALCARCGAQDGELVASFDTIFGLEEDQRILSGRYGKVY